MLLAGVDTCHWRGGYDRDSALVQSSLGTSSTTQGATADDAPREGRRPGRGPPHWPAHCAALRATRGPRRALARSALGDDHVVAPGLPSWALARTAPSPGARRRLRRAPARPRADSARSTTATLRCRPLPRARMDRALPHGPRPARRAPPRRPASARRPAGATGVRGGRLARRAERARDDVVWIVAPRRRAEAGAQRSACRINATAATICGDRSPRRETRGHRPGLGLRLSSEVS